MEGITNTEKAELINSISKALKANKKLGTYREIERSGVDKIIELIESINLNET